MTKDKWIAYLLMRRESKLRRQMPETRLLNRSSLEDLMSRYTSVMLKPRIGKSGYGVMQLTRKEKVGYELHAENERIRLTALNQLKRYGPFADYIVQQRIDLARIDGRPYDLRVMVQRKPASAWQVTGIFAKVAASGYTITNVATEIMTINEAFRRSGLPAHQHQEASRRISALCLRAADVICRTDPRQRMIGFDIGLDSSGKAWIIEANRKPQLSPFLLFKDKSIYRKIMSYKK